MDEWTPIVVLPNLNMGGTVECAYAAILSPADQRIKKLCQDHPRLKIFLSKFAGQFGEKIWPSVLLLRADAPKSFFTPEAITALRDLVSLSVVPYARALRLRYGKANSLVFSNTFQLYPWMLDKNFEDMLLMNPAQMHIHLLEEFKGQSFPEQSQASLTESDIDQPLLKELLSRWVLRFSGSPAIWKDIALFRSLNMANEAGRIPALTAATFYDTGRSLGLWVSAYEILAHPGGATGQSNFGTVSAMLESVKWHNAKLSAATHTIPGKTPQQKQLATWICKKVYDLRNDFLHGNEVEGPKLLLNGKVVIDFAACLYRLALTGFLDLHFSLPTPPAQDAEAMGAYINQRMTFNAFQSVFEGALLTAI